MNEYDSGRIAYILEQKGFLEAIDPMQAELVILNTCSVREKPEHKVDSLVGKLSKDQRLKGLPAKIGVMGCVAQQEGVRLLKRFTGIDFVLGTDRLEMLDHVLDAVYAGERVADTGWNKDDFTISRFEQKKSISSQLTIMKGCENFCSYCIVPFVRGKERSRTADEILGEVRSLVGGGVRELTLLGQNVNSYAYGFSDLLKSVAQVDGLLRLRFVTSHPKDFSMDIVKVMADYPNICPLIHLPLQSGSDRVLKAMNRGYTWEQYYNNIMAAKEIIPGLRFSSDFIVGFPGETEEDYLKTVDVLKKMDYESCFIFNYSPRPGTAAEMLDDDVPLDVKGARLNGLVRLQESISERRYTSILGEKLEILVEGPSKKGDGVYTGRTVYNKIINFTSDKELSAGTLCGVTLTEVKRNTLYGHCGVD